MPDGFILEIPEQVGQPVAAKRTAQAKTRDWPAGTRIVSADSHMLEGDLWVDRFPPELRDAAPRMVFKDGGWDLSIGGKSMTPQPIAQHLCDSLECYPGLTDVAARLADLDIEGVEKELIFPQRLFGLMMFGEIENKAHVFGAYNEHIAEMCAQGEEPVAKAVPSPKDIAAMAKPPAADPESEADSEPEQGVQPVVAAEPASRRWSPRRIGAMAGWSPSVEAEGRTAEWTSPTKSA